MQLLLATLLVRLIDPVTILVAVGVALRVKGVWGVALAAALAVIAAEIVLALMQTGHPLLGFSLIGGFLAGLIWAAGAKALHRKLTPPPPPH